MNFIVIILALGLDHRFGEPKQMHPLRGFAHCADWIERVLNRGGSDNELLAYGALSVALLVLPPVSAVFILIELTGSFSWVVEIVILYLAIGLQGLIQYTEPIFNALSEGDIERARDSLDDIIDSETPRMNKKQITTATIESSLGNGSDILFGNLFWFMVGGAPLVVLYRLVNTLDGMWGYHDRHFEYFGKVAARIDDILNFIPARLAAVSYAMSGKFFPAIKCWWKQAKTLSSLNRGPLLTAGAGSLDIELGGKVYFNGRSVKKPSYGGTRMPSRHHINLANNLLIRATIIWCIAIFAFDLLHWLFPRAF